MANLLRVTPHAKIPGLLAPQTQSVDFNKYVAGKTRYGSLAEDYLYVTSITNINTESFVGMQWGSDLAKSSYILGQIQIPYYKISSYVEWDIQEEKKFESLSNGVALPDFLDNLAKQAINQRKHQAILFGFETTTGYNQGIAGNETIVSFPQASNTNNTLTTYPIGELQAFLSQLARKVMDTSFNMAKPVVIASSVRVINYLRSVIVPLTSYLESGSVASVGTAYNKIVGDWLGVGQVEWVSDNLLMNADITGQQDVIKLIAPGIDPQGNQGEEVNQNLVGDFNSIKFNTFYDTAGGLIRFDAPPALGKFARRYDYKMTPGVNLRNEAVVSTSIVYS